MGKNFDSNYIKELAEEISKNSLISYEDFPKYDLFLSQVIDYLNDKFLDEKFTNNIVQNYTKSEVITKPEDGKKRGYTKTHLTQLVLLGYMRPILTTEEIKKVFRLAFNEINDRNDDILAWEETYKTFIQIQKESLENNLITSLASEDKLEEIIKTFNLKDKDKERIKIFLLVLSLIAEASVIKKLVQKIVNEYETE
ncbi:MULTISPECIES: DUF1836 domain-containing protein [Clostridium]|jgi:hypothetical protein|uniref:DUF1836 domain-containing protein n=1 Tax=Clostridium saccharoperbutylacetonicum N1-4(HMT) TaxID=931276 RepID=M1MXN2_9CLOT|nr:MULTISPECIES: DUF1836 domain-containing protein [Clostridium]AGF59286.1 hypothetical protein DUF1836 [Clostridium saccharoperbutylacetonicum N1-4(HMT)]AQR97957.1 hypothetical protein CLSAP_52900 [Clostridium saccharoperbutylacetonicum]NRT59926.1 hypothetical protein [Clostridium saccharoperbutylacetonicum]NSB23238.1 hypothetical protein [Clostridium saccharoperbutylacetonicum]NSB33850.1 hypothetical protein [Clostridium saccharoperbutylacetonicum]